METRLNHLYFDILFFYKRNFCVEGISSIALVCSIEANRIALVFPEHSANALKLGTDNGR